MGRIGNAGDDGGMLRGAWSILDFRTREFIDDCCRGDDGWGGCLLDEVLELNNRRL